MTGLFDLEGKVVVVTGGSGLLGAAFSEALSSVRAKVIIADINIEAGRRQVDILSANGGVAEFFFLNIAEYNSISDCIKEILSKWGRIDAWINNAYPRTKDWNLPFEKISPESWRVNIDSHLNGYCFCCQQVAEHMKTAGGGSIINIASIYGSVGPDFSVYDGTSMTMPAAYSVIKGGVINFTRYLASYYGPYGVRVNAVSPGGIAADQPAVFREKYEKKTPLRRMGTPRDIVGAIVFLSSEAGAYVTGHNLVVDGGWSAI